MRRRSFLGLLAATPLVSWTSGVTLEQASVQRFFGGGTLFLPFRVPLVRGENLVVVRPMRPFLPSGLAFYSGMHPDVMLTHGPGFESFVAQTLPAIMFSEVSRYRPGLPFNPVEAGDELQLGLFSPHDHEELCLGCFTGKVESQPKNGHPCVGLCCEQPEPEAVGGLGETECLNCGAVCGCEE